MRHQYRPQAFWVFSLVLALLFSPAAPLAWAAPPFPEFVDPHPAPGNQFGSTVVPLATGNVVITSPFDDEGGTDAGAVYLFNGATGVLISTLLGSTASDRVGGGGVTALANGNYVVRSPLWDNGAAADAGAVTWGNGTTGIGGTVGPANSLVGTTTGDRIGTGAALVGIVALTNSNYVVSSGTWDNGAATDAGAVTWGSGTTGISGAVSASNSLVGTTSGDQVGFNGVIALTNGNYVVRSPNWEGADLGAVTWGPGATGISGAVSASNSLVGSAFGDQVGLNGVAALTNGNYVVASSKWDDAATTPDVGAATWANGTTGITGVVSASNSLVGSFNFDGVGGNGVTALTNGNYVVVSPFWTGAQAGVGAATWANGATGMIGTVSASNSLVGSTLYDEVGFNGVTALANGHYVVSSPLWDNGAVADAGAATWGNGTAGTSGVVSPLNSLVGSTANDQVASLAGFRGVAPLSNGNYVVRSPLWDGAAADVGAATWGNGASGINGTINASNSLVGSTLNDQVGATGVTALTNGNYVVLSRTWDGSAVDVGAATWGSGTSGVSGQVTVSNSLVGSTLNDQVGQNGVTPLSNGNYVVGSLNWDGAAANVGAVTWGNGTTGVSGVVSASNSLVGATASDTVGSTGVTALTNGNYVVASGSWDGAATNSGAATWGPGATGISGVVSAQNSLVGAVASAGLGIAVADDVNGTFFARFVGEGSGRVRLGSQADGVGPPFQPTVTSPTSTLITGATATIGGDVTSDGGSAITERGVVYAQTATNSYPLIGGTGVTKVPVIGATGLFAAGITGLSPTTSHTFRAFATNAIGTSYTSLAVFTTTCPTITLGSLPDGAQTVAYTGSAIASGGTGPYTYAVTSGTLPGGLALTASGAGAGDVLGTPTLAGTSTFDITATDTAGPGTCTGVQGYSVVIGPEPGRDFFTLTPCRVFDTRSAAGALGGPALAALNDRIFVVAGACGIPADAKAISVNIAVTGPTNPGNIRLHPGGMAVPLVSSINFKAGQTRSNNGVIPLSALGELGAYLDQASGTAHLILDVNGYFK